MKRRRFIEMGVLAGAGLLATGGTGHGAAGARAGANRGVIFKAVEGGHKVSEGKLAELKALGFDGGEGVAPGIEDIPAVRARIAAAGLRIHGTVDSVHW